MKYLLLIFLCFGCTIEEEYPEEVRIVGEWASAGRTAVLKNGDVFDNWYLSDCETQTNYIFYKNGFLHVEDFIDNELNNDGTLDFCKENLETSEDGTWEKLPTGKFQLSITNQKDSSKVDIKPYAIEFIGKNRLEIRYKEFSETEGDSVSYLVYRFFRIYRPDID